MMATAPLRKRLAELDAQIVEQKLVLDELERKRTATVGELYATAAYPVLTLPVEITADIFIRCLPDPPPFPCPFDEDSISMGHELRTTAPLILLGVCRVWRDIALDTPTLWSTLNIRFDAFTNSVASEPGLIESFIDLWLGRAGNRPLSISLSATRELTQDEDQDEDRQWSDLACAVVQRYSQRVRHLKLQMTEPDIIKLGLHSATFPLLHSAMLWCVDSEGQAAVGTGVNVFANAPRLRTLVMHSDNTETLPLDIFTPPWSQLTKFNGIIKNLDLFTLASNLTEAKCFLTAPEVSLTAVITHSRLQSLTIEGFPGYHSATVFLQHLTLPALRSLNIAALENDENPPSLALEPFLQRSRPPLMSLSFSVSEFTFDNWAKCLACVTDTLENLEIRSLPDEVLFNIFRSLDLPNLRTLSLLGLGGNRIDFDDLLQFLSNGGTPHLSSLRLVWQYSPFLDREMSRYDVSSRTSKFASVSDHLADLARGGMKIHFGTDEKNYIAIDGPGTSVSRRPPFPSQNNV
ncbi:hypothetical protein DFH09DRAFT_93389 [Mycena vulgaris]|nr:hypothetical protein DFH09DRAFT_93389 [Mycena vulgaris]